MKRKSIKERIAAYFFRNPTVQLRVRHIERIVKVPLPAAIRYAKELEKEGILKKSIVVKVTAYSADRTSPAFLFKKRLFNLEQLQTTGLIDFLKQELSNSPLILFGSYARGEDTETSDIDVYIETPNKETLNVAAFEKKLERTIQLFQYPSLTSIDNKQLANNIFNGIILNGFIEVFK